MSVKSCFFLLLGFLALPVHGAGLEDADERLFQVQLAMAQQGNTRAQYYLGEMHEQGLGTKQDVDEAFKWYAKAAEQGDALAKRKLANREEIVNEIKREQEIPLPPAAAPITAPGVPTKPAGAKKPGTTAPIATAQSNPQPDPAKILAEKEKRRAAVRAMIRERMRNPAGELFGE